jgi:hypothetical protein
MWRAEEETLYMSMVLSKNVQVVGFEILCAWNHRTHCCKALATTAKDI